MKKSLPLIFLFLLCISSGVVNAQDQPKDTTANQLYVVTKIDGTQYIGKIISDDGREVLIETEALGKIYIPKSDIKSIVKVKDSDKEIVHGEFRTSGPFTTRYCFTTNALPIKRGENYGLINLYGPEVHFALSDHFSLGVMSTWLASPLVIASKYSIATNNPKLNFSIGTLIGTSGYLNQFKGFGGLHFANVTFGDRAQNITFSAGYGYAKTGGEEWVPDQPVGTTYDTSMYGPMYYYNTFSDKPMVKGPIFSVAGIAQVGTKASFVFDSMIGVFSDEQLTSTVTVIRPADYSNNIPGIWRTDVENKKRTTLALFIMPAMRFQSSETRAFQVALAGVATFRDGNASSFPFPMCTWFFKF